MKRFIRYFLLAALVPLSPVTVAQPAPIPTEAKVRELLDLTGAEAMGLQMMDAMIGSFSDAYPQVPEGFWEEFRSEIKPDEISTLLVPVYQRHLTVEEVDELIRFFSSPAGRSFVRKQPQIMTDSMAVGSEWGRKLGERVVERMKSRGLTE